MAYATTTQVNNLSKAIENKTLFTEEDVVLNVENLSKIEDCSKFSFVDFMNLLNLRDTTVTLSTTLSSLIHKIGTTIHGGTTLTATITKGTYDISKIEFFVDDVLVATETSNVETGGVYTYGYGFDITTDKVFKVKVTDAKGIIVEDVVELKFYNPYYYGKTNKELVDITDGDISTMTQLINKKENQKIKYTMSDERAIFAYDKIYGDLKSILDPSSFENISSFTKIEMTISGVLCNVYVLDTKCYCTDFEYLFVF